MIIYPAIDLINGQCVRLTYGDYSTKKVYHADPLAMARTFEEAGFTHLHVVDLDGAKAGKVINDTVVQKLCHETQLTIDFGGGIRSQEQAEKAFSLGVNKINVGSLAVKNVDTFRTWLRVFGGEKIILSADVKNGCIATHGWQDQSDLTIEQLIRLYLEDGLKYVTCTDISKDGALQGASVELYETLIHQFPDLKIIASGGVHNIENIQRIQDIGCHGAIVGKAIYEGKIELEKLAVFNRDKGLQNK